MNAEEPEDTQIVLGNATVGVADEAHASCRDIRQPADMVMHDASGVDRQPVDREIAPFGVARPVATECNLSLAAVGLDVLAQGRDLERPGFDHQRHGTMLDTGRYALDAGGLGAADHLGRQRRGRDIDVADRDPEQCIANRARRQRAPLRRHRSALQAPARQDRISTRARRRAHAHPSFFNSGDELAVLDMGRNVGRVRRRAGKLREQHETDRNQHHAPSVSLAIKCSGQDVCASTPERDAIRISA